MKKAFTMLELVFVIVVIGILAAVIIPNTRTNPVAEAAIELVSKIRYAQHLAMLDDKYDATPGSQWFKNRWQIVLSGTNNELYSIVSENNTSYAKDPQNSSKDIQNFKLKGVSVVLTGGCNGENIISFDHLGRPLVGSLAATTQPYQLAGAGRLLTADCTITLSLPDGSEPSVITIMPETGYAKL